MPKCETCYHNKFCIDGANYKYAQDCKNYKDKVLIDDALEKQTPKKPTIYGDGVGDDGEIIYDSYDCPSCGVSYELDYDKHDYCLTCGQALDWSESDE